MLVERRVVAVHGEHRLAPFDRGEHLPVDIEQPLPQLVARHFVFRRRLFGLRAGLAEAGVAIAAAALLLLPTGPGGLIEMQARLASLDAIDGNFGLGQHFADALEVVDFALPFGPVQVGIQRLRPQRIGPLDLEAGVVQSSDESLQVGFAEDARFAVAGEQGQFDIDIIDADLLEEPQVRIPRALEPRLAKANADADVVLGFGGRGRIGSDGRERTGGERGRTGERTVEELAAGGHGGGSGGNTNPKRERGDNR